MFKLLVVVAVVAAVATHRDTNWAAFKAKHHKNYTPEEEPKRKRIWEENMKTIEKHNKKYKKGLSSFSMGENEYSDMTSSEFFSKMSGKSITIANVFMPASNVNIASLPKTVDWRKKGYVTPVKNQKDCRASWAFSATGAIEGQHFNATGKLVSLSESNLIDCSKKYGNKGCHSGFIQWAFEYVIANKGIDTETGYPYKPKQGPCKFKSEKVGATISYSHTDSPSSENKLQKAVAEVGPISVMIDSKYDSFRHYKTGIYDNPDCKVTTLDQSLLVVGYGTDKGKDYWLVKNSWGTTWGDKGYIMMSRNKGNQCGIGSLLMYPIV